MKSALFDIRQLLAIVLSAISPTLTGCDNGILVQSNKAADSKSGNNNGGFDGKPGIYVYRDTSRPCQELNANGQPLPNMEIFISNTPEGGLKRELVRDECRDITPVAIAPSELTEQPNGAILYRSFLFTQYTPGDFDVRVAECPAGMTRIASATPSNEIRSSLDFLNRAIWGTQAGVMAALHGSFAGLPAYEITRTMDAAGSDWRRWDQSTLAMPAATPYALSFFAKRGTASTVKLEIFHNNPFVTVKFRGDLTTGGTLITDNNGINGFSATSRAVADGYFFTMYFTLNAQVPQVNLGFASLETNVGDSIFVTNPQLVKVPSFCSQ